MISSDISNTETVRNVFVIDDKGIIRTILIYPLNIGRFIPEIIRIVQALQMSECSKRFYCCKLDAKSTSYYTTTANI